MRKRKINLTKRRRRISFPSEVISSSPNGFIRRLAPDLIAFAKRKNEHFHAAANVHPFVRDHFVDPASGTYGIEKLIAFILRKHGAEFRRGIERGLLRRSAIAGSLYGEEIIKAVRKRFGSHRYPYSTIHSYLSFYMCRNGTIAKIKLSNSEDQRRKCCKPRLKYYLVKKTSRRRCGRIQNGRSKI